jgi:hypothetical protein
MVESDPDISVRQEIDKLVEMLKPQDRRFISNLSEAGLGRLHHGYGMWLRNQFRQNQYPHLFRFCSAKVPPESLSFDAISAVAIRLIWRRLLSG